MYECLVGYTPFYADEPVQVSLSKLIPPYEAQDVAVLVTIHDAINIVYHFTSTVKIFNLPCLTDVQENPQVAEFPGGTYGGGVQAVTGLPQLPTVTAHKLLPTHWYVTDVMV